MYYLEILDEAATAPLYHGTTFSNAMDIVKDGFFRAFSGFTIKGQLFYGVSTSRSPRFSHIDHDPNQKAWEKGTIEGFNVIFVLDQNKIRQRHKIVPYDYFKDSYKNFMYRDVNKLRDQRSESEEFIVLGRDGKLPLAGNVSKIIYFPKSFKNGDDEPDTDEFFTFKKWALTHSIPVVLNYTLFDFGENDRPWNRHMRQSMITHADKHEVQFDPKDHSDKKMLALAARYNQVDGKAMTTEQLADVFSKGEQFTIWNFWLRMNGRFPAQRDTPVPANVMKVVFNAIKNTKSTIYRKISPFVRVKSHDR